MAAAKEDAENGKQTEGSTHKGLDLSRQPIVLSGGDIILKDNQLHYNKQESARSVPGVHMIQPKAEDH